MKWIWIVVKNMISVELCLEMTNDCFCFLLQKTMYYATI